eukprot:TRINITY_DN7775_c0_g1_i1.p1 TRINITY_DN7775_c0_g1~~TRINITY_DN7775_c0_g1_i1.p1  ORF type:complete len:349 (-),score=72.55 TRINITY_DN7775_c0_g1_i1:83-1129(-)
MQRRHGRAQVCPWLTIAALCAVALHCPGFVGLWSSRWHQPPTLTKEARSRITAGTFSWDREEMHDFPATPEEMAQQAADATMRAYRDGITRQHVHFRLDQLFDMESLYVKGATALQNATLPLLEEYARNLWGGEYLKNIRVSIVDQEAGTLIYRESDNEMQDMSIFYLAGRDLVLEPKTGQFLDNMKDRLVVLANPEEATAFFNVAQMGKDFPEQTERGYALAWKFRESSYYYTRTLYNQWQMVIFRSYPFQWQVWIENLQYELVRLSLTDERPTFEELDAMLLKYEKDNNIRPSQKVGKWIKDAQQEEEASEEASPGWRSAQSGDDILRLAKEKEAGRVAAKDKKVP